MSDKKIYGKSKVGALDKESSFTEYSDTGAAGFDTAIPITRVDNNDEEDAGGVDQFHNVVDLDEGDDRRRPGAVRVRGTGYYSASDDDEAEYPAEGDAEQGAAVVMSSRVPVAEPVAIGAGDVEDEAEAERIREEAREQAAREVRSKMVTAAVDDDARARTRRRWLLVAVLVILAAVAIALGLTLGRPGEPTISSQQSSYFCAGATGPLRVGAVVESEIVALESSVAGNSNIPRCGPSDDLSLPGRWFRFTGTGTSINAFTCSEDPLLQNFETRIKVFSGQCDELNCVGSDSNFCGHHSLVSWMSKKNEDYYIFVSGSNAESSEGSFKLTIKEGNDNDSCEAAAVIVDQVTGQSTATVSGTISPVAKDQMIPKCGTSEGHGLWYKIRGNGRGMRASACNNETTFAAQVAVFESASDGCDNLVCKIGRSDDSEGCSSFSWRSTAEETYYVFVYESQGSADVSLDPMNFKLTFIEFIPVDNDECSNAATLEVSNQTKARGDTRNATFDDHVLPACASQGRTPGVFYRVLGTGSPMRVSLCNDDTSFNASIQLLGNECRSLTCVAVLNGFRDCEVAWTSEIGVSYYLHVAGRDMRGPFSISVESFEPAVNDLCKDAIEIAPGEIALGSTLAARINDDIMPFEDFSTESILGPFNLCILHYKPNSPAVWYRLVGTGERLEVSTCNNKTTYDTVLTVARGACDTLSCIDASDNALQCGSSSKVQFDSILGESYHIRVDGWIGPSGIPRYLPPVGLFGLTVKELGGAANDYCETAQKVYPVEGVVYHGSTSDATRSVNSRHQSSKVIPSHVYPCFVIVSLTLNKLNVCLYPPHTLIFSQ